MFRLYFLFALLISNLTFAAIDTFEFSSDQDRQRFRQLSEELRCPKCQNQNLAGSDSAIALDLRTELYKMILAGQSNSQIKTFMVDRYGEFVLYKPSINSMTYALWYGPFVLLLLGFVTVFFIAKSRKKTSENNSDAIQQNTIEQEQVEHQMRIQELLDRKND